MDQGSYQDLEKSTEKLREHDIKHWADLENI